MDISFFNFKSLTAGEIVKIGLIIKYQKHKKVGACTVTWWHSELFSDVLP